jgi:hypothetical protein
MNTRNWYAWLNLMPPRPDDFHVVGEVEVGNPGIVAELHTRTPQGINPDILQLDLHLVQRPGIWVQVMTWTQSRYDRVLCPGMSGWKQVEVFHDGQRIALIDVDTVH